MNIISHLLPYLIAVEILIGAFLLGFLVYKVITLVKGLREDSISNKEVHSRVKERITQNKHLYTKSEDTTSQNVNRLTR